MNCWLRLQLTLPGLVLNEPLVLHHLLILIQPLALIGPGLPWSHHAAAGSVDVWSLETGGEPILHYQVPAEVQSLSMSPDCPVLASVSQNQVRLDQADDCGYWRTLCCAQLHNAVGFIGSLVMSHIFIWSEFYFLPRHYACESSLFSILNHQLLNERKYQPTFQRTICVFLSLKKSLGDVLRYTLTLFIYFYFCNVYDVDSPSL